MREVFYAGKTTGYQVVGKTGVKLVPGINRVPYEIAQALIDMDVVTAVAKPRARYQPEPEPDEIEIEEPETDEAGEE